MRKLLSLVLVLSGCGLIDPTTKIQFSPLTRTISIYNNKDVDLTFEKLDASWTPDGGTLTVKGFLLSDKSSPVIKENVQQMLAFVEQQTAANEGIIGSLNAISDMVRLLTRGMESVLRGSGIQIDTPWGSGSANLGGITTQPSE